MALCAGAAWGKDEQIKVTTVDEEIRRAAANAPLRMIFKGSSATELKEWQTQFEGELRKRIGLHTPPAQWTSAAVSTKELDDHTREEWLLKADGVPSLPVYVLRPRGPRDASEKLPIVMCVHGHGPYGNDAVVGIDTTPERIADIKGSNYDYGRQLVRQGYLIVAPCLTPFGRRLDEKSRNGKQDACATTFIRLMMLGQTLIGANLRDLKWALDFACRRSDARSDRVGCVGLSYGGRMTMVMAALDSRVRVAVISGALNAMQERIEGNYSCGAQVIPGLLEIGDTPEIGSLIAPRPCIWEAGSKDGLVKPPWTEKAVARLSRAYGAAGKPENLQIHHFEGGHRWDGVAAVPLLEAVLKH